MALAGLAAATSRIRIGVLVTHVTYRNGCTPDDPWAAVHAFADFVGRYQEVGINEFILLYPPMTDIRGAAGEVDRSLFEHVATEVIPRLRNKER